jgi:hypothetical protein
VTSVDRSSAHRYRIVGRFLQGDERLYGEMPPGTWEIDAKHVLAAAQASAEEYGRWSDLRLERASMGEWETVA